MPFTEKNRVTLIDNNVKELYIPTEGRRRYQKYIENNLGQILQDDSVNEEAKAVIVYDSAKLLVKDVLSNPTLGENIRRSQAMVESTVDYILRGGNAFRNLLMVMSFDYYTYTHSVNVCTFSLALARFIGINDVDTLNTLGTGALLHDVGKTKISESILQKQGPLSPEEMELIKKHPEWGSEIIKKTDLIPQESYYPIVQHHERENGSGYPNGLKSSEIHHFSKIAAVADVFDAMTTRRAYRPAMKAFPALKTMFADKNIFDRRILERFTLLLGPHGMRDH
jgi:putative nucleotidyltransferase with HDIG domain